MRQVSESVLFSVFLILVTAPGDPCEALEGGVRPFGLPVFGLGVERSVRLGR